MSNINEGVEAPVSSYSPPSTPSPGRFVRYHQFEDGCDWPALILEVKEEEQVEGDEATTTICFLQVFRPRANHWKWAPEGTGWGYWSWPIPSPALTTQPKVNCD